MFGETGKLSTGERISGMEISIIVPVYNVEKYLQRCIDSLVNQTCKEIEIILVNDGSTDNSPAICEANAQKDSRIRVLNKKNGGLSDARNAGLNVAVGQYILFVDSDDYIEVDTCARLLTGMHNDVDLVAGAYKEEHDGQKIYKRHTNLQENVVYSSREFVIRSIQKNEWYAPAWLNLYRRQFLLEHKLYYKVGILFEDHEMLPRLFLAARKVTYIDYPFYNYVIRSNSIMTSNNVEQKRKMSDLIYNDWMRTFSKLDDVIYQRYLYGILIRYYLRSCCSLKVSGWKIKNMNFCFALRYALNVKEKIKVILFATMPNVYLKMGNQDTL